MPTAQNFQDDQYKDKIDAKISHQDIKDWLFQRTICNS